MNNTGTDIENILITGSTGFVCKYLIDNILATTNYNIIVTYRSETGKYEYNKRVSFKKVDLIHPNSLDEIFSVFAIKYVIHLAAMARVSDGENNPEEVILVNFISTVIISKLCVKHNVKALVFTSSNLAQDAVSVVGMGKYLVEQYFQTNNSATKFICLRMPNVIDSNGSVTLIFKQLIKDNKSVTITHPHMSRLFVTGKKSAEMLVYLMQNGIDKAIYVSNERPVKIVDLALSMIKESRKKLNIEFIGIKPGEKLNEKYFDEDEVTATELPGLGILKHYKYDIDNIEFVIQTLKTKNGVATNATIANVFEEFKR